MHLRSIAGPESAGELARRSIPAGAERTHQMDPGYDSGLRPQRVGHRRSGRRINSLLAERKLSSLARCGSVVVGATHVG